jgi:hypothetical protein
MTERQKKTYAVCVWVLVLSLLRTGFLIGGFSVSRERGNRKDLLGEEGELLQLAEGPGDVRANCPGNLHEVRGLASRPTLQCKYFSYFSCCGAGSDFFRNRMPINF